MERGNRRQRPRLCGATKRVEGGEIWLENGERGLGGRRGGRQREGGRGSGVGEEFEEGGKKKKKSVRVSVGLETT